MSVSNHKIQPEVIRQTKKVAVITICGLFFMWAVFWILSAVGLNVSFDKSVVLGGIGGSIVAILSFFMIGMTVQSVVAEENEDNARMRMKAGYSKRMMLRMFWGIAALIFPCFNFVAAILPLLFPNTGIKLFYKWMSSDK